MLARSHSPVPLPAAFVSVTRQPTTETEVNMAIINLRDYYPFYTSDCFMEVSEEVADSSRSTFSVYRAGLPACLPIILIIAQADRKIYPWVYLLCDTVSAYTIYSILIHKNRTISTRYSPVAWWRRGELNPCPKIHPYIFLRAQFTVFARKSSFPYGCTGKQAHPFGRLLFIGSTRHSCLTFTTS